MNISLYNLKCSNFEYKEQPKILVYCTRNHPTQDGIPPQEGSKSEIIPPPKICLDTCINLVSIPANPVPPTQEDFGRDKDLKTLLKSLQPKNFLGKGDNFSNILEEWIIEMEDYFALAKYNSVS